MTLFLKVRRLVSVLCACVMVVCISSAVTAVGAYEKTGSITLDYKLSGTNFYLYKVASIDDNGTLTLTDGFAGCDIDIATNDNEEFKAAASKLKSYVNANSAELAADDTQTTNENGRLTFDNLKRGVYLVLGNSGSLGNVTYTPSPVLFYVPQSQDDGLMKWYVTAELKYDYKDNTPSGGGDTETPDTETPDTETTETTETPETPDTEINIVDKVPSGDTQVEGTPGTETEATETPETPDDNEPVPDKVVPVKSSVPLIGKLPQTGQLWWPVAALSAAGLCFITVGLKRRKDTGKNK